MKNIISTICGVMVYLSLSAQTLEPIKTNIGKLNLSIDPRMELLGAIQTIADYPLVTKNTVYSNEVKEYFASMKNSKAISITKELYHGFSYDAPASFMLYMSQPYSLKEVIPYSQYLIGRAGGKEKLDAYRDAILDFAKKSKFKDFWKSKENFYKQSLSLTYEELKDMDPVKTIEEYYKDSKNSYNIILCPLFGSNNYGAETETKSGNYDIYSLTCTFYNKEGIPFISKQNARYLVLHEFSHSFVNPLTEKHTDQVKLSEKLLEPIKNTMSNQAYGNWETVLNEHIIRAFTARIVEISYGEQAANNLVNSEKQRGFVYIEPIIETLKEYEKERDTKGITFAQYFPTLLSALAKLNPVEMTFEGNINNVLNASKLVVIYPTAMSNSQLMDRTKQYVVQIAELLKQKMNKECVVLSDSAAVKSQLNDCGILCYGTIQSNLFLRHYTDILPFQMKDGVLTADKDYSNSELRFISCVPNPQNNKYGMTIYTALKDENIININSFKHGMYDYHIFGSDSRESLLLEGYYNKSSKLWKFNK